MHREDNIMDFENFVASIVKEKFQQFDEEAADAREQQGIAQVGLGTRPMSDRPGLAKEEDEVKVEKLSTATRVISDMSDYYQPEEFPTQEVRVDNAPRFSNINRSTVLDILSANRDGLEKQGIIKMPMGMLRQPDPTLDIDGLQSRILDKLDLRPPEGSVQDIQYGLDSQKLGDIEDDEDQPAIKFDTPDPDSVDAVPKPELGGLMAPKGDRKDLVFAQEYLGVTVDNKFGPQTSRALAAFQYNNNIPISGRIDDETIEAMKNPDTLDPREPTIRVDDVLNAEGTRPDIEKLIAWSKKNIKDPLRAAAFVATVEAESGTGLVEGGYSKQNAIEKFPNKATALEALPDNASGDDVFDVVYGGRFGNTEPNDGSKYKGRGLIQLTFKANYEDVGNVLGLDLVNNPELVNDPKHAVAVAMTYFTLPGKNFFTGEITTRRLADIVGHSGGAAEARNRFRRVKELQREMYE